MGSFFVGEIRMFGGNFAPFGWAMCQGQLLPISQYEALYSLIGTTYGGDGQVTFALPNLQGRVPIHQGTDPSGNTYILGQLAGSESVTITSQQMPSHNHIVMGSSSGGSNNASGNTYGSGQNLFSSAAASVALSTRTVGMAGGSQPHSNLMPFVCVNFIIALEGIYPQQS